MAVTVVLVATLGYMLIEGWTFGEAFFEALMIISTVGLKESRPASTSGDIWTAFVTIFGIASIAVIFSLMTSVIVSGELRRALGRTTLLNRINQLSGHFIICGYGRMGQSVHKQLKAHGAKTVIIERDTDKTARLEEQGELFVLGDASEEEALQLAGVTRARGLVAALPEDSGNVFVTLTARGLRDNLNIVARAEQPSAEPKLLRAGANRVICPAVIGATRVANLMTRPSVADFIEVTARGVELELDEYVVDENSPHVNQTLQEANLRSKAEVMVVAIKRADGMTVFSPGAGEKILEGDTLIIIGQAGAAARLR